MSTIYDADRWTPPPSPKHITVTVRDAYEALVKNGFEHLRAQWVTENSDGTILGGCAVGQAALNLGVLMTGAPYSLQAELDNFRVKISKTPRNLFDYTDREAFKEDGGVGIGSLIIGLNDALKPNTTQTYRYSWYQIVSYAYKFMEPFFDETIELQVQEFKLPASV